MSWTEIEIDETGRVTVRRGGTLTGEPEPKPEPDEEQQRLNKWAKEWAEQKQASNPETEPEPKPKLVTWRLCVRIRPDEIYDGNFYAECEWYRSGDIPEHWYPVEAQSQPIETIKQLPEGQEP